MRKFVILLTITSKIFLYKIIMKKVSLQRYYFVLYDAALTLTMSKMALTPFCNKTLHDYSFIYLLLLLLFFFFWGGGGRGHNVL